MSKIDQLSSYRHDNSFLGLPDHCQLEEADHFIVVLDLLNSTKAEIHGPRLSPRQIPLSAFDDNLKDLFPIKFHNR